MTTGAQHHRRRGGGLYVHVPFCASICSYCHFARTARHDAPGRARLVAAVVREFALRRERCAVLRDGGRPLLTAYVGGGTPSSLEPELMTTLLAGTVGQLPAADDLELTVEANPESLDAARAAAWRAAGVNRVSLGVQSLDADVLRLLGRACDPATARAGLRLACASFPRVSADWILGPGVREARLHDELDEALDLGVEHISLYILEVHEGTPLARRVATGKLRLAAVGRDRGGLPRRGRPPGAARSGPVRGLELRAPWRRVAAQPGLLARRPVSGPRPVRARLLGTTPLRQRAGPRRLPGRRRGRPRAGGGGRPPRPRPPAVWKPWCCPCGPPPACRCLACRPAPSIWRAARPTAGGAPTAAGCV